MLQYFDVESFRQRTFNLVYEVVFVYCVNLKDHSFASTMMFQYKLHQIAPFVSRKLMTVDTQPFG